MDDPLKSEALEASNAEAKAVAKTDNRVDLSEIHEKISSVEYWNPTSSPGVTVANVVLDNGFSVIGKSGAADPKNFNVHLGRKFAVQDAVRKIWELEGYLLKERMYQGEEA
ncbi:MULTISPECIES: Gp49 family protein [Pseudomonadota]|uniref:Gp49 family protein n=1 Tax=Pseudomonadota TaxID=1224 RepID=UPI0026239859|nr:MULTISPECIES: Gp49 family protein [Pseudomonadota]